MLSSVHSSLLVGRVWVEADSRFVRDGVASRLERG